VPVLPEAANALRPERRVKRQSRALPRAIILGYNKELGVAHYAAAFPSPYLAEMLIIIMSQCWASWARSHMLIALPRDSLLPVAMRCVIEIKGSSDQGRRRSGVSGGRTLKGRRGGDGVGTGLLQCVYDKCCQGQRGG
jgi:hypothetical protein